MDDLRAKIQRHHKEIEESLEPLRKAITNVINGLENESVLPAALESWKKTRQQINNAEGMSVVVGIGQWRIIGAPLVNDPEKDIGQARSDLGSMN